MAITTAAGAAETLDAIIAKEGLELAESDRSRRAADLVATAAMDAKESTGDRKSLAFHAQNAI
jgi:hypothetical protein